MKTKSLKLFAGLLSVLLAATVSALIAGCDTTSAKSSAAAATPPNNQDIVAKSGAQLWSENCARCHNLRSPSTFSDSEWDVAVHHMRIRANLTAEESKKILEFLKSSN